MIFRKTLLVCLFLFTNIAQVNFTWAEPLIVLEFSSHNQFSEGDGKNEFSMDPNHSKTYMVKSGDSLNSILKTFYKGSGLDWRFVQLSIVLANPKAFANSNPNFLFSDKKLYLPGKADISKLLVGKEIGKISSSNQESKSAENIYFFGG